MDQLRYFLILCLTLFSMTVARAQSRVTVTGKVEDEGGLPLPAAAVFVKGTRHGTVTKEDGTYSLTVDGNAVLTYSSLGYITEEQPVKGRGVISVVLKEDKNMIAETIVTGYSKQERRDITGAISSVALPEIVSSGHSVDQLLAGRAAGVFVSASSGALGSANLLTIRGVTSIMGDNNPLYVVDGVPIYGTDRNSNSVSTTGGVIPGVALGGMSTGGGTLQYDDDMINQNYERNPLLALNPEDIESIEILKDAYATAIYGSRGAAGVILITTRKGSAERSQVSVNYSLSLDTPMGKIPVLNGDEYAQVYSMYYPSGSYKFQRGVNTDWVDAVTRTAVSHKASASVNGGTDKIRYFISLGYSDAQSYVIANNMRNYNGRINLTSRLSKHLTVGANMSMSKNDNSALEASKVYNYALKKAPNIPIRDEKGNFFYGFAPYNSIGSMEAYNPVAIALNNQSLLKDTRSIGNVYAELRLLDWLSVKSEAGMDFNYSSTYTKVPELPESMSAVPNNHASELIRQNFRFVNNNTINLNYLTKGKTFWQAVIGQSYEMSNEYGATIYGSDFFSPDLVGVGAAQNKRVADSGTSRWALFSAFARGNVTIRNKYIAGITYRLDGSSRFNRNHRYLSTPSLSLGWRLSEENFAKKKLPWLDDFKVRASVGWQSKDAYNSYYGAQATYVLSNVRYGGSTYLKMSQPGNVNLSWEKTITYDAGIDASFLDRRIELTVDYYYRKTVDMLFASDVPGYTGYAKQDQNIADMRNSGIEVRIVSKNVQTRDWGWLTTLNLSRNTNKILKLNFEGNQLDQLNTTFKYYAVGYPVAQWYLHQWAGVDPATGDPLWRYNDGTVSTTAPASDWKHSQENKAVMGTALPTFYGGLTNTVTFRNLELNMLFSFSLGGRMINATKADLMNYASNNAFNLHRDILKMWQLPGQQTDVPKLANNSIQGNYDYTSAVTTTRYLEKSDYLRLKNIELSWSMGPALLSKVKFIKHLRVYALVTNLFTLTPYSGLDPETSAFGSSAISAGYDYMTMPQSRSYQFGTRITF